MIIGRKKEMDLFNNVLASSHANFVAVYGRRRIGKTFLIRTFFEELVKEGEVELFYFTGSLNTTTRKEIIKINKILKEKGIKGECSSWYDVFKKMEKMVIDSLITKEKVIIFLDEVPWLDKKNSDFLNELAQFWDTFLSTQENVVLIISGSSGSWMQKKVLQNTKELYNRVIEKIQMKPFTLKETAEYMKKIKGKDLDLKELLLVYIHYGGIPYYLNKYKKLHSLEDNIKFLNNEFYKEEYNILLESIFGAKMGHHEILMKLVHSKGKELSELITGELNIKTYQGAIKELIHSDFITKVNSYKDRKQDSYILTDEFFMNYFDRELNNSLLGLRFERIILKHIDRVIEIVNEDWEKIEVFFDVRLKDSQIDFLLIGKNVYIFELKNFNGKYSISGEYQDKIYKRIENVKEWLRKMRYNKKEIKTGFITTNGLVNNSNSREHISISLDDLL